MTTMEDYPFVFDHLQENDQEDICNARFSEDFEDIEADSSDDFFRMQSDYCLARDRAYSWDLNLEGGISDFQITPIDNKCIKNDSCTIKICNNKNMFETNNKSDKKSKLNKKSSTKREFKMENFNIENQPKKFKLEEFSSSKDFLHPPIVNTILSSLPPPNPCFTTLNGEIRPEGLIGAYTKEQRKQRIDRFREKKLRRIWQKQIKYDCRKRLADTRPRVKGRFVSRKECAEGENEIDGEFDCDHYHEGDLEIGYPQDDRNNNNNNNGLQDIQDFDDYLHEGCNDLNRDIIFNSIQSYQHINPM